MFPANVYQRRAKPPDNQKNMVSNEVEKHDSWIPETPAKPSPKRQPTVDVVGADGVEFNSASSSKKRKINGEINDQLPKGTPKKIYRPKVVSQISKRTNKSQAKSNTPKPSTPKQRRSYVKRGPFVQAAVIR
ncbi:hypothetical protein E2542_SST05573 [Spatholobus suberectus]|nr:hypothetical protein E2542_SST05573 [Spatholobus suberectus]